MSAPVHVDQAYEKALFAGNRTEPGSYFTDDIGYWVAGAYGHLLDLFGLGQGVRLAPSALHRLVHLRLVAVDDAPEIERTVEQLIGGFLERVARPHLPHVVLHVLRIPAAGVRDEGERRKHEAELGPEGEHRARDRLDVVLATCDDEGRHLVPDQDLVLDGDLVLHAVQALDHLVIQRGRIPPANGRADQYDVGPMHQPLVDCRQLILGIALGDGTGPRTGARRLRVVALTMTELEITQFDVLRIGSAALRLVQGVLEQRVGSREARVHVVHRGGGDDQQTWRRSGGRGVGFAQMRGLVPDEPPRHHRWRLEVDAVFPLLDREDRDLLLVVAFGALPRDDAVLPGVPGAHHELAVEAALRQRAAFVVAGVADRAEPTA